MKIAYITTGAGKMYCGSCLRDNTLAGALMKSGQDVRLIPTYTPTRTDETNNSRGKVFLGGINVFLQQHSILFRKSPATIDRLWDFAPLLKFVTGMGISVVPAELGDLTVSMLKGSNGFLRKEVSRLVHFLADEVSPEIINLPNSLLISLAPAIKKAMNVPVCCTLQGEDLFLKSLPEKYQQEALQLIRMHAPSVDAFIAVSEYGAQSMSEYLEIDRSRIHVVPLGINFGDFELNRGLESDPFTIGYLARICPEKGLHFLCEAYQILKSQTGSQASRLWAAGYLGTESKPYLASVHQKLSTWGLLDQFHYHGELDRQGKMNFLKSLNIFSVPEPYAEPKGLFLLEALACGIPVVQPRRGAFPEIINKTGGGLLVEPDNPDALAEGLLELWKEPARRMELGAQGYEGVRAHYSAQKMAENALAVYQKMLDNNSRQWAVGRKT
jgi:glycosyltransferase involved in cell wall biosynthesis